MHLPFLNLKDPSSLPEERRLKNLVWKQYLISHTTFFLLPWGQCDHTFVKTVSSELLNLVNKRYGYACPGTRVIHTQMCPTRLPLPRTRQNIYQQRQVRVPSAICRLSGTEHSKPIFSQNVIARNNVRTPKTVCQTRRDKINLCL